MTIKSIQKKKKDNRSDFCIDAKKLLGFWIYLMSDCIIFGTIFSVYFVMGKNVSISLITKNIFNMSYAMVETVVLLLSSVSYGIVLSSINQLKIARVRIFLIITFILGLAFIIMEFNELYLLCIKQYGPNQNSFFSAYFTLLGIHALHIIAGLIWIVLIFFQSYFLLTNKIRNNYICLGLFWHFIDIIWICIFNFIYLVGSIL